MDFDAVAAEWTGPIRAIAARLLGSQDDIDDCVQDTFLRLCEIDREGGLRAEELAGLVPLVAEGKATDMLRRAGPIVESLSRDHEGHIIEVF